MIQINFAINLEYWKSPLELYQFSVYKVPERRIFRVQY